MNYRWLSLWLPPLAWMGFLYWLSAQPDFPALSPFAFPGADKAVHLGLYGILGLLLWRAARRSQHRLLARRPGWSAFIIGWFYGFVDEAHQFFVPPRLPDVKDFFTDGLGLALGIIAAGVIFRISNRTQTATDFTTKPPSHKELQG